MENLTKENFWNEMMKKYPAAMKEFCDWVDKYKKENNWNYFFGAGHKDAHNYHGAPKYHNLPLAMQVGIFQEFISTRRFDKDGKSKQFQEEILRGSAKSMISTSLAYITVGEE